MNIMLLIVSIASFVIGQFATGSVVGALVLLNVIMGTNQERKAMASVEALAELRADDEQELNTMATTSTTIAIFLTTSPRSSDSR
jgi:magnesium-transporting ATPase (P-type)